MKSSTFRHIFRFKLDTGQVWTVPVLVKKAVRTVVLTLLPEHVKESIRLKGVGNTQTCTMAICAKAHKASFPHPVDGYVDWTYRRAYVVTKTNKHGQPTHCVVYAHRDGLAPLNDTPGGQQKILARLLKHGKHEVTLYPIKPQPKGRPPGVRKREFVRRRSMGRGAKLRFARAIAGGFNENA